MDIGKDKLEGVHPKLVELVEAVEKKGVAFKVFEGLRSKERQAKLVASGASKTLDGKHLKQSDGYGHAIDVVPLVDGKITWDWKYYYPMIKVFVEEANQLGIKGTWGGVWDKRLSELDANKLETEVNNYGARRRAIGKKPFLDGPHIQLEG